MRDLERWKDKVELSLDGRQIFFLFFGSAVAACVIFIAGVLVGKHIEQRAMAAVSATPVDPLAVLDQVGAAEEEGLTFHQVLAPPKRAELAPTKTEPEKGEKGEPVAKPVVRPPTKSAAAPAKPARAAASESPPASAVVVEPKAEPAPLPKIPAEAEKSAVADPAGHFTLQLSAFSEKDDADQFLQKIQSAGYRPFVVQSEVPGRGLFYRVRVGDFSSRRAALEAKTEFERKQHLIAYVARL